MSQGDEPEFQGGTASDTEGEQGNEDGNPKMSAPKKSYPSGTPRSEASGIISLRRGNVHC
jgi:hypothetical protein